MKILYLVIVLLVAILAVMFAAQNSATVAITFFAWSTSGSLSLVLVLTLTLGILIGVLIMAPSVFRHSFKSSGLKRRVHRLEKEKTNLNEKIAATGEKSAEAGKQTDTPPGTTAQ
jgi:uncharacterized integral membrane protein